MYEENNLLTPMIDSILGTNNSNNASIGVQFFIGFINQIEGWKTKCKNLHWAAPKKNIHVYLDEFLDILCDYQDSLAEETMGIFGKFQPNIVKAIPNESLNAADFINEVKDAVIAFYDKIPCETIYKGITSETETFIHNVNKYRYLFSLTDIRPY